MENKDILDKKRLMITLDFSKAKENEVKLYEKLTKFTHPQGIIKDILLKNLPVDILYNKDK